jgi:hypothetical protein
MGSGSRRRDPDPLGPDIWSEWADIWSRVTQAPPSEPRTRAIRDTKRFLEHLDGCPHVWTWPTDAPDSGACLAHNRRTEMRQKSPKTANTLPVGGAVGAWRHGVLPKAQQTNHSNHQGLGVCNGGERGKFPFRAYFSHFS